MFGIQQSKRRFFKISFLTIRVLIKILLIYKAYKKAFTNILSLRTKNTQLFLVKKKKQNNEKTKLTQRLFSLIEVRIVYIAFYYVQNVKRGGYIDEEDYQRRKILNRLIFRC